MVCCVEFVRFIVVRVFNSVWEVKGLNLVKDLDFFFVLFLWYNEFFIYIIYEKYLSKSFDWRVCNKMDIINS